MPTSHEVASLLSDLTESGLEKLLNARPAGVGKQHNLHDLADTLCTKDSIEQCLKGLSRTTLESLASGKADSFSVELLLAGKSGKPFQEVKAILPELKTKPVPKSPVAGEDSNSVMLHTVVAARDLIELALSASIPMGANGSLLKAEERNLANKLVLNEEQTGVLVGMAQSAGLVRTSERRLFTTELGVSLRDNFAELWKLLSASTLELLGESLLAECKTSSRLDADFLSWALPLATDRELDRVKTITGRLTALGILAGGTTPLGLALLNGEATQVSSLLAESLPELETNVFVLDDLSLIGAGPLESATEAKLDLVSIIETRGLAPKRRIDSSIILRSLVSGKTADELNEGLQKISKTPLSAAVQSTILDVANNSRFVVLGGTNTDTAAKASHPELGAMLLTDPRVQRLAPVQVDDLTVLYGASRERVEATLLDCNYTVVTKPEFDEPLKDKPTRPFAELAEHLAETGLGETHLERSLVTAGKSKKPVTLVVDTGSGHKTITLEPRQVANGRVRGLDTKADVERTLPISAIIELKAVGE